MYNVDSEATVLAVYVAITLVAIMLYTWSHFFINKSNNNIFKRRHFKTKRHRQKKDYVAAGTLVVC